MANFTDLTGLAGVAIAAAASVRLLPGIAKLSRGRQAVLQAGVSVLMLLPFGDLPLAAYVRGMTGDLSITTLMLLGCSILRPWLGYKDDEQRMMLLSLIALTALVFYPMALGAGTCDPYQLGYGSWPFIVVLLLLALTAWLRGYAIIALCIALATLAWSCGWYESGNLWDYLIDPFVAVYALASIINHRIRAMLGTR